VAVLVLFVNGYARDATNPEPKPTIINFKTQFDGIIQKGLLCLSVIVPTMVISVQVRPRLRQLKNHENSKNTLLTDVGNVPNLPDLDSRKWFTVYHGC